MRIVCGPLFLAILRAKQTLADLISLFHRMSSHNSNLCPPNLSRSHRFFAHDTQAFRAELFAATLKVTEEESSATSSKERSLGVNPADVFSACDTFRQSLRALGVTIED